MSSSITSSIEMQAHAGLGELAEPKGGLGDDESRVDMLSTSGSNKNILGSGSKDKYDSAAASKEIVRYFDLAWFAMTMSWGGAGLGLANFQGVTGTIHDVFQWIGVVIWIWNCIYWVIFQSLFAARIVMYPGETWAMVKSPKFNFIGCWSMGFAVCAMGFSDLGHYVMPEDVAHEIAFWMFNINVGMSVLCAVVPVLFTATSQAVTFDTMPSIFLLPVVANVVNAALGGMIGFQFTADEGRSMWILFCSMVELGCGLFSAACMIAVYLCRLMFHGMPPPAAANSIWVILGPIGQGANAIMRLGRITQTLGPLGYFCEGDPACATATPMTGFYYTLPGMSLVIGLFMWGFGMMWVCMAATGSIYHTNKLYHVKRRLLGMTDIPVSNVPYNVAWWGCVFPFVTQLNSTYQLYVDTKFGFFMWAGRVFCIAIFLMALYVHYKTIHRVLNGSIWQTFKPKAT